MKTSYILGLGVLAFLAVEAIASRKKYRAYMAFYRFGSGGGGTVSGAPVTGGFQASPDVQTANCTPAPAGGQCGSYAMYCNPPGVECGCGSNCADARAQYCQTYGVGGECLSGPGGFSGPPAGDQGLPGQGPIIDSGAGDIQSTYGFGSPQVQAAMQNPYLTGQAGGFAPPPGSQATPYGYAPSYGYGYGGYPQSYGYGGYPQQQYGGYGYGYPPQQSPYGYGYGYPSMPSPYGYGYGAPPPPPMMPYY